MEERRPKRQVRDAIRLKHYSYRAEQTYVGWIKRYIYFHNVRPRGRSLSHPPGRHRIGRNCCVVGEPPWHSRSASRRCRFARG
jgi:hypothetical protein